MRLRIVEGDLLDQDVEVIVNTWNRNVIPWWLLIPRGVSGAIKRRAGYAPFKELAGKGILRLGEAVETSAGNLPHKAMIHVAGIGMLWVSSERSIVLSVRNAIRLVEERGYRSIAFPLIGAGTGGTKGEKVLGLMKEELEQIDWGGEVRIVRYKKT